MRIPAPGRIVNGLHIQIEGQGSPLVVLEAGIAASSVSWSLVQKRIAEFTTVLSYDRAGFGWSPGAPSGGTALEAAQNLAAMLDALGMPEPYVLAGHSFGGLIARLFQQQYPERTAGLVLIDPVIRAEWRDAPDHKQRMLRRGVILSRRGALLARLGVVGFALRMLTSGSQRVPRFLARVSARRGAAVADRLVGEVRKMPQELWPAIAQNWSEAKAFEAMADNLENLPRSVAQLDERLGMGDLPLAVLSAAEPIAEHQHDAKLSTRGEHIVVPDSGHWIQLDASDAVVTAVHRLVAQVRAQ